jgi:hypothetical protein
VKFKVLLLQQAAAGAGIVVSTAFGSLQGFVQCAAAALRVIDLLLC